MRSGTKRLRMLWIAVVALLGFVSPTPAHARHGGDAFANAEKQRRHTEEHKMKRREQAEVQGEEIRDSKKSEQDSKQSQLQSTLGTVNQQGSRFSLY